MTVSLAEATAAARRIVSFESHKNDSIPYDAGVLAGFVLAGDTSLESGSDSAWPVREVLRELADAANHLLREHDCDHLGWETIEAARQAAVELQARPSAGDTERLREALEDVRPLVAACLAEFTSAETEGLVESEGGCEPDESEVALPSSHITFGMIRQARRAFAALAEGSL